MALSQELEGMVGSQSQPFNILWRDKQLEYSFRKAAMKQFNHFSECTSQALDYCDAFFNTKLSNDKKAKLLGMYRMLPAFEETASCLKELKKNGDEIIAFSNGKQNDLISLFEHANIIQYFNQIISVDEVKTFKPSPAVYELLAHKSSSEKENTWLVSANSFDIIGASAIGLKTIWLKRDPKAVFDPFGITYTYTFNSLSEIFKNPF